MWDSLVDVVGKSREPAGVFSFFFVMRLVRIRFCRDAAGLIVIEFRGGCSVDSSTCKGSQRGKPCFLCNTLLSMLTRTLPRIHISPPQSTRAGVISCHKLPDSRLHTLPFLQNQFTHTKKTPQKTQMTNEKRRPTAVCVCSSRRDDCLPRLRTVEPQQEQQQQQQKFEKKKKTSTAFLPTENVV